MNSKAFNRFFYISLVVLAIIYGIGMQLTLMDVDASTYALLSKQMFNSGNYLQLYLDGGDYLDKPPLVFWLACLSFKLFGIHDWAYRLPSVLCLALGIYSTYRYTRLFYTERAAKLAALIMASCMACYVMTSDVRIDTMLTGWVMFAMWQFAEYFKKSKSENNNASFKIHNFQFSIFNLLLGGVGVGLAMITKGPIGLIIPVTAFSVEFIYKRQWKNFFRWQYLLVIIIIALILLPMSIGLYEQFDLHPEKVMYDKAGTSGLRFFYWTQSFGRITGESTWNNNPDPFFLYHSFLWSFAPWCVLFIPALILEIRNKIKNIKKPDGSETMAVGGFVLILIFLSRSKYQLPHYTFAIHPLAAIITAKYLDQRFSTDIKSLLYSIFRAIHLFLMLVIYAILFLIVCYIFPAPPAYIVLICASFCAFVILFFIKPFPFPKILVQTIIPFITLALIFNTHFYPRLLKYQTGSYLAKQLNNMAPADSKLIIYKDFASFSMRFYSDVPKIEFADDRTVKANLVPGKTFILADSVEEKNVLRLNPEITIKEKYYNHSPAILTWGFLNPETRMENIEKKILLQY